MKMTQRERVLLALQLEKRCGTDFLRFSAPIPRYSARIQELRDAGHEIVRAPCRLHHHETPQFTYELTETDQGRLFG